MDATTTFKPQKFTVTVPSWLTTLGATTDVDIAWLRGLDLHSPADDASRARVEAIFSNAIAFVLNQPNGLELMRGSLSRCIEA